MRPGSTQSVTRWPLLLPGLLVGQPLVRQASQTEAGVADADPLAFIGHHLRGDVYQRTLFLWHHQTGAFSTVD